MNNKHQRIVWPWETKKWPEIKQKITDKIHSIVDMDSRIASIYMGKLKPRQITELFNNYYTDEQYKQDRVPQDVFIEKIIPMMQKLISDGPKTFRGFNSRILAPAQTTNIAFTRPQIATILAGIWFGIFDYNYLSKGVLDIEDFPEPTFINIFSGQNLLPLQCLINYFYRVYSYISGDADTRNEFNGGTVIIKRRAMHVEPDWRSSEVPISEIFIGDGHVDDSPAKMHIAFAHDFIGGDMFKNSLTQEEIVLLVRPECIVSTLFCARLEDNEVITILGAEKMNQYTGYGTSVHFAGNFIDISPRGFNKDQTEVLIQCAVVFMDASSRTSGISQFISDFNRDLNKAYCGFSSLMFSRSNEQVASGNWSYGFNGNNMQIKFIQQVLAASLADKCLVYHPFGRDFEDKLMPFIDWIARNKFTVGELFTQYIELMKVCYSGPKSRLNDLDIFDCLMEGV